MNVKFMKVVFFMLKIKVIEDYKPPEKTIELINSIPTIKLETTYGYMTFRHHILNQKLSKFYLSE